MKIVRVPVLCHACCTAIVGVWLNIEPNRGSDWSDLVPLCEDCGKLVRENLVTPGRLHRMFASYGKAATLEVLA